MRRLSFQADVKETSGRSVLRFAVEYKWYRSVTDWSWGIIDGLSERAAVTLAEDMQVAFLAGADLITPSSKHRITRHRFACKEASGRELSEKRRMHGKNSPASKAASAQIAMIPYPLARWIGEVYR